LRAKQQKARPRQNDDIIITRINHPPEEQERESARCGALTVRNTNRKMLPLPFLGGGGKDANNGDGSEAALTKDDPSREQQHSLPTPSSSDTLDPNNNPRSVLPLSMRLLRYTAGRGCCAKCNQCCQPVIDEKEIDDKIVLGSFSRSLRQPPIGVSPLVVAPMTLSTDLQLRQRQQPVLERILLDYKAACQFYHREPNAGVLTTLRYSLPGLRVTSPFYDSDMLALAEILLQYGNGPLQYIRRLDFSKHRKIRGGTDGFGSHGALCLAKVLQYSEHVTQVLLERNPIGPYGAAAIFMACAGENSAVDTLLLRRCRIGERGALALAAYLLPSTTSPITTIDLSANHCGYHGCIAVERALQAREQKGMSTIIIDLEGNLVFQEICNGITHGLGVLMAFCGAWLLSNVVADKPSKLHSVSCGIYSTSLVVLYTSSTLYHSFFSMRHTKWVFEVLDKSAIYILIAGSYTPFLTIVLHHEPIYSIGLLIFLWVLCFLGIGVEFGCPTWAHKGKFSLAMYLGMGWSAIVCLPEVARILPRRPMDLMVLGGVAYTTRVPFFVRNNNLDHAIWHLFVLAGSIFHWCGIYFFVAPRDLSHGATYSTN